MEQENSEPRKGFLKKYLKFRSSLYGRVVYINTVLALFIICSFGIVFRSIIEEYMRNVIQQRGTNIGLLVSSALHESMLTNDRGGLQNTLNTINQMSGIDDVNLYDQKENLAYSSFSDKNSGHSNPNCISCHTSISEMFQTQEDSHMVINVDNDCEMNQNDNSHRHLLILSPIANEKSCYTSACHSHSESEKYLGSLVIKIPLSDLDETQSELSTDFYAIAGLMTLLLLGLLTFFTRKKIKEPLNSLMKVSEAVTRGDRSSRVDISSNQLDDMVMVSQAFNAMLDNLQTANDELSNWSQQLEFKVQRKSEELGQAQNELVNIERIASLGKLSLSVAHEINNPLSGILIYTKLVQKQISGLDFSGEKRELSMKHLKMIENETKRCGDIVKGLLDFSRKDQNFFEDNHLHEIMQETYDLMAHSMKISKVLFIKDFAAVNDLMYCNANQIKQACIALLVNAQEAVTDNAEISIRTYNIEDNTSIVIEISDNGVGISQEDLKHVFEPFYSSKRNVRGTGLGLAIVHGIIQNHNGKIEISSKIDTGTVIKISIPLKSINNDTSKQFENIDTYR